MKYEIKKIVKNKVLIILFLAAVAVSIFVSLRNLSYNEDNVKVYENPSSESYKYKLDYYDSVNEYREKVCRIADRLKNSSDEYVAALNSELRNSYQEQLSFVTVFYTTFIARSMWNGSNIGTLFFLVFFLSFVAQMFFSDVSANMIGMLRTTYKTKKIFWNKLKCIFLVSVLISVLKVAIEYLPQWIYGNIIDLTNPIQSIEGFQESPYNISILAFIGIDVLLSILSFLAIGMLIIAFANILKKIPRLITLVVIISGIWYYMFYYITKINYVSALGVTEDNRWFTNIIRRFTTVFTLFDPVSYFKKAEYINIFGMPVRLLNVTLITAIIFVAIMIFVCRHLYLRRDVNVRS